MNEQDAAGMVAGTQAPGTEAGGIAEVDRLGFLSEARLLVIDTETTGFRVDKGARAIEVAAVLLHNLEPTASFAALIQSVDDVPEDVTKIHGITTAMVRGGINQHSAWSCLTSMLSDADALVFHNAPFDLPFVAQIVGGGHCTIDEEARASHRKMWLSLPVIDTLGLARALRGPKGNKLAELAAAFAIQQETAHRALGDALMTARILPVLAMYTIAKAPGADWTIASLSEWSEQAMRDSERAWGREVNFRRSAGLE